MNLTEEHRLASNGDVGMIIDWKDGRREVHDFTNTVLKLGRRALALSLANQIGDAFDFYITRMLFGDGGTQYGVKKYVSANRNGLFGTTRLIKPVLANIDSTVPTQVILTSVLTFDDVPGITLNEMGLQMANGDLFSLTTFADLMKTEEMQITFNWRINFV